MLFAVRWGARGQQKEKKWFRSVSLTCIRLPATPQLYIQTTSWLTVRCEPPAHTGHPQLLSQWACKWTLITSVEGQSWNCFKWSVHDSSWIYLWAQSFPSLWEIPSESMKHVQDYDSKRKSRCLGELCKVVMEVKHWGEILSDLTSINLFKCTTS